MTGPQADHQTVPQYVYGVTRADAAPPNGLTGLDDLPVRVVAHGRIAALSSDLPSGRPLGERADLMAHQRVLQTLVDAGTPVLPFRFGAALADADAVRGELLENNADRLTAALDRVDGRVAVRVKATYEEDAVLREVIEDDPEIAELSARLRAVPEDAADAVHFDRVRLGEMIVQVLRDRRERDGTRLLSALAPFAESAVAHEPVREEDVVDASFLVGEAQRDGFQKAVDDLVEENRDRIRLRLVGPLPPYDFVPEGG
ncbi:GvpL/GvpF family gas vesicle protein [Actinomadura oligospora]|uniref:GvpL/GvpF family gas vesicle protein n=1 Tax=Actinomadura oligospora TaxID=111804 RepID=UPI0004B12179|nr:GvpL/GvpF family gas vesicle protein [Actinomadura oligospora]